MEQCYLRLIIVFFLVLSTATTHNTELKMIPMSETSNHSDQDNVLLAYEHLNNALLIDQSDGQEEPLDLERFDEHLYSALALLQPLAQQSGYLGDLAHNAVTPLTSLIEESNELLENGFSLELPTIQTTSYLQEALTAVSALVSHFAQFQNI